MAREGLLERHGRKLSLERGAKVIWSDGSEPIRGGIMRPGLRTPVCACVRGVCSQ